MTITELRQPLSVRLRGAVHHQEAYAFPVFKAVFKEFGLPKAIRTDNGVPFASPNALFGLSKVSVTRSMPSSSKLVDGDVPWLLSPRRAKPSCTELFRLGKFVSVDDRQRSSGTNPGNF